MDKLLAGQGAAAVTAGTASGQPDKVKVLEDRTKKGFMKVKDDLDKFKQEMKGLISAEANKLGKRLDSENKTLSDLQKSLEEVQAAKDDTKPAVDVGEFDERFSEL